MLTNISANSNISKDDLVAMQHSAYSRGNEEDKQKFESLVVDYIQRTVSPSTVQDIPNDSTYFERSAYVNKKSSLEQENRDSSEQLEKLSSVSEEKVQKHVDQNHNRYSETHSTVSGKYSEKSQQIDNSYGAGRAKSEEEFQEAKDKRDISKQLGLDELIDKLKGSKS